NKAIELNSNDLLAFKTLGYTYDSKGLYERNRGQNPHPSWDLAIEAYQKMTVLNPNYAGGYNNLGAEYAYKSQYEIKHGKDPNGLLELATKNYRKAIELNPNLAAEIGRAPCKERR